VIGRSFSPAVDAILGGWQVNGIWTLQAGPTLNISVNNNLGGFSQALRANWDGRDPVIDGDAEDRLGRWFDTSVFSQPAPFTFGNALERIPGLRAHRLNSVDFSVFKEIAPTSRLRVQVRIEAFNVLNGVQFGSPQTSVNNASFGQVTSQANAPRQLQFGLKMLF